MQHKLISGDNHIDLTYFPTDLWLAQAPTKWKKNALRVEERNDGQHWFVNDKDRGMWNGVGPGFLPYTKDSFDHIDEMKEAGFEWDNYPGARPRPTTPESIGKIKPLFTPSHPPASAHPLPPCFRWC